MKIHFKSIAFHLIIVFLNIFRAVQEDASVFIMAGQSNMEGWGCNYSEIPSYLKDNQTDVLLRISGQREVDWTVVGPGLGGNKDCIGPELDFGRTLADYLQIPAGNHIVLIKHAKGGTNLFNNWRPPSAGGQVGQLYTTLFGNISLALQSLKDKYGITGTIKGMIWMQGEADSTVEDWANSYEKNLNQFIGDVRKDLNSPKLPFIIAMIDKCTPCTQHEVIRNAEWNVARNDNNVGIFDTNGFATDGLHYYTAGQIKLGNMFGWALLPFIT